MNRKLNTMLFILIFLGSNKLAMASDPILKSQTIVARFLTTINIQKIAPNGISSLGFSYDQNNLYAILPDDLDTFLVLDELNFQVYKVNLPTKSIDREIDIEGCHPQVIHSSSPLIDVVFGESLMSRREDKLKIYLRQPKSKNYLSFTKAKRRTNPKILPLSTIFVYAKRSKEKEGSIVQFRDLLTAKALRQFHVNLDIKSVSVSLNGKKLLLGLPSLERFYIVDAITGKKITTINSFNERIGQIEWATKDLVVGYSPSRKQIVIWSEVSGNLLHRYKNIKKPREGFLVIPGTDCIALIPGCFEKGNCEIQIINIRSLKLCCKIACHEPTACAVSGDGKMLAITELRIPENKSSPSQHISLWSLKGCCK